jgi:hypothetical protein
MRWLAVLVIFDIRRLMISFLRNDSFVPEPVQLFCEKKETSRSGFHRLIDTFNDLQLVRIYGRNFVT